MKKVNFTVHKGFYGFFHAPATRAAFVHYETENAVYMVDIPASVLRRFFEDGDEARLFNVIFEANRMLQEHASANFELPEDEYLDGVQVLEALERLASEM